MNERIAGKPAGAPPAAFAVRPIGYVRSPHPDVNSVKHSAEGWTPAVSRIRLLPEYAGGLGGLEGYSHVIVLFWAHRARDWKMPRHHRKPPHVKIFATRMPVRPNPIGLSVVDLLTFSPETGEMTVRGLDAVDGTPLLDIKPYIPNFDSRPSAQLPQWVVEHMAHHFHGNARGNDPRHIPDPGDHRAGHGAQRT